MKAYLFPGQGSQKKGMGAELFPKYPEHVKKSDAILGYSIEELCVADPNNLLNFTTYTQPAIFVVSVLNYLEMLKTENRPGFAAGHSIGEYAALFAAEAFNFETGLQIVKKRAELMSQAEGGLLAAVIGLAQEEVEARITASGIAGIEIANINSPTQIVVGGPAQLVQDFVKFSEGQSGRVIPLKVSGAFHTSHMRQAQEAFRDFLSTITFSIPRIGVVSNYSARLHTQEEMAGNLANHLANRVRWTECIEHLLEAGVEDFTEIGSKILTPMVNDIRDSWVSKPRTKQEARLDLHLETPIAAAAESDFEEVADWTYPALGTTSFGQVLDRELSAQANTLLQLYLTDSLTIAALREFAAQHEGGLIDEAFINMCDGMNKFELRAAIRQRVQGRLYPHVIRRKGSHQASQLAEIIH
jgi:trans-AT polyketide synthase/acyltransferase/oxidoreductase domain-containing protein